ncbi:MAG TPA: phosphoribosylamine--glycine ligase [Candidatus Wujingus californicus]|uniref:phosphoribosylamine--glycine ligase n=1 Tax=Candidatus Wujingus californicus TaxID=3367618 RepID=UPI001DB74629|nr:phosphoribosylamine--glycine ligase [Planctomycetota bacterium]MDO8130300.1 phosphoribosylamine--glycine ligase [Candidatus Brocadiales bacterium]
MKVLVVGSGGREHALVWKIAQSPMVKKVYCAPGNPGISEVAECVNIDAENIDGLYNFALKKKIDLTVVGPEDVLVAGIVDRFKDGHLNIFGPNKRASVIEGSKVYAKTIMKRYGIPTADFKVFDDLKHAKKHISTCDFPLVIKADGLAKGKGVFVCKTLEEADRHIDDVMKEKIFGYAGERIVIEEFLSGEEVSILAITDGKTIVPLSSVQDHKAVYEGDKGPNTGGMGAYSPVPFVTDDLQSSIEENILVPIVHALKKENRPYKGVIYAGLMITNAGPKVLEFNARFGDPETQVLLMRMKSDLVPLLLSTVKNNIEEVEIEWHDGVSVCVIMASKGYPDKYEKGLPIFGLESVKSVNNVQVFHAGTVIKDGKVVTNGGRVLGVTILERDLEKAQKNVYEAIKKLSFDGAHYRKDIGTKAINKKNL